MHGPRFVRHQDPPYRGILGVCSSKIVLCQPGKKTKAGILMNPQQIALVQQTFALAAPRANEVAACFYQRLFDLDPTLRPLFTGDLKQQGEKLMTVLAFAVRGLQ